VLGPDNLLLSADWIGAMRASVEKELGGLALFLQGATGDLNPDMYWEDARAFEMVKEEGERVARAVVAAVRAESESMPVEEISIGRREAWLPFEAPANTSRPPKNYAKPLLAMAKLPGWLAFLADPLLNQRYPWKSRIEARDGCWSVPMRINALRIGELVLVTFGAEVFTEIGMKVRQASPGRYAIFTSLSDGCISYLPTDEAHRQGGYEVNVAPLAYRYPSRLAEGGEALVLDATRELLKELWLEKSPA
jgi:neutral ceramidase